MLRTCSSCGAFSSSSRMRTPVERVLGEWKNVIVSSVAITHLTGSVGSTLAETSFFALSPIQSPNRDNACPRRGVAHHAARLTPSTSVRDDKASARCRPTYRSRLPGVPQHPQSGEAGFSDDSRRTVVRAALRPRLRCGICDHRSGGSDGYFYANDGKVSTIMPTLLSTLSFISAPL